MSSVSGSTRSHSNTTAWTEVEFAIDTFIAKLKRRQIEGSYPTAIETLQLLMRYVSAARWNHVNEFIDQIRDLGYRLEKARPTAFSCGNVIRRVLAVLRDEIEEDMQEVKNASSGTNLTSANVAEPLISSLFNLLQKPEEKQQEFYSSKTRSKTDFRQIAIQTIKDLMDEIQNVDEGIQQIAIDLIHDNEVLLTPTPDSRTVSNFLIRAREHGNRIFTVIVPEGFPNNTENSHKFAKRLAQHNIETIVVPDSAVFALMSRVGKVIIGSKTVFVNGGSIVSSAGVSSVCECAREFKTPVFAVTGLFKLSPLYPFNVEKFVEFGGAQSVLAKDDTRNRLDIVNKVTDYIPPENIDIYITNIGGFAPSFIYRIAWDNYKQVDVNLEQKS